MSLRTLQALALGTLFYAASAGGACVSNTTLVPGAECQLRFDLPDLATPMLSALNRTDPSDWGTLHSQRTKNPLLAGPGVQIDGYFPDSSVSNSTNGWLHDAQFVMRFPRADLWNGKLVITGAPGVRKQYATDYLLSDWFVARGYAYAATDKGNTGTSFYNDGVNPGEAVVEWNRRVTELTIAAKAAVQGFYGVAPRYTYITGISNGGYLTRFALETHPELYDGGVDWEGTHWRPEGPNLFTFLPAALKYYPTYRATGSQEAHDAMINAGFAPGSEMIWEHHYAVYWDLTQRTYREEFDPAYDGAITGGIPFCPSGAPTCDADYDYFARKQQVGGLAAAVNSVSLTGRIGKPMITLHGTLDALLPIRVQSDHYVQMVNDAGKAHVHRYYVIEGGNHVDQLYDEFPDRLRPIVGCYRAAFLALERWVEGHGRVKPAKSQFIPRPASGDITNECPELGPQFDIPSILTLP
jgi:alpha-beta hydrolase superfamily lysophospholipase